MDTIPLRSVDSTPARTSFAGFDAIRALAALGVVLLHSCVPYLQHRMPGLAWPVRDATSSVVDFAFWSIELFIMPLFLVLAGFLAWQTLQRRGPMALVKSRSKRLLRPLLFGVIIVLPLDLYSWVLGWVAEGLVAPIKLKSFKFDGVIDRDLWGLSHLWFLQYLLLYVLAVAVMVVARDRFAHRFRFRAGPRLVTTILIAAGSLLLFFRPEVVWGFQHSFLPVASKWLYGGVFFAFGAMLAAYDGQLKWLKESANRFVAPAILLPITAVVLGRWHLHGGRQLYAEMTLAVFTCGAALMLTLSIIGVAVKRIDRVSVAISYLAAASFWVYVVHHPIVGLVHLDLKWLMPGVSPVVKTALAFTITSGVCLLSYEGLARRTALGRWLGFSWQPPSASDDQGTVISIDASPSDQSASDRSPLPAARKAA